MTDSNVEGPYLVATVAAPHTCTLSYPDGRPYRNNEEISTSHLEFETTVARWIATGFIPLERVVNT
jgi:hypothetical protein